MDKVEVDTPKHIKMLFWYDHQNKYFANGMMVKLTIKSRRKILATGINLAIDSEIGALPRLEKWIIHAVRDSLLQILLLQK